MTSQDFVVIGAGIAGASVARELAAQGSVVLLERESQPGYHSTGRSAALFSEIYGGPEVRALSRASRPFLFEPPAGFDRPLIRPRGALFVGTSEQAAEFARFRAAPDVAGGTREITAAEAMARMPILRLDWAAHAAYEPDAMDVEVHALHQGFLRSLKERGGQVVCNAEVIGLARDAGGWEVTTPTQAFRASIVVNAAGAWADVIAGLAGIEPLGLTPLRRTALIAEPPAGHSVEHWPMLIDVAETFYVKPDAGRLLLSPADETPVPPCDVQPDDLDVAIAVDRVERATTWTISRVHSRWAGLRSFVADRTPVAGFDPAAAGFFWLSGQGGYGIQTAPGLARTAAALATGRDLPADLADHGVDGSALAPERLRRLR